MHDRSLVNGDLNTWKLLLLPLGRKVIHGVPLDPYNAACFRQSSRIRAKTNEDKLGTLQQHQQPERSPNPGQRWQIRYSHRQCISLKVPQLKFIELKLTTGPSWSPLTYQHLTLSQMFTGRNFNQIHPEKGTNLPLCPDLLQTSPCRSGVSDPTGHRVHIETQTSKHKS